MKSLKIFKKIKEKTATVTITPLDKKQLSKVAGGKEIKVEAAASGGNY